MVNWWLWWVAYNSKRLNVILLMEEIVDQLVGQGIIPLFTRFFYLPGGLVDLLQVELLRLWPVGKFRGDPEIGTEDILKLLQVYVQ